jgi:hypothetical protein
VFRFVNVYVYNWYHGYTHKTSLYTIGVTYEPWVIDLLEVSIHVLFITLFLTFYLVSYFPPLIDILTVGDYIKIEDVNISLLTESPSPCWNIKYNIQYITVSTSQLCIGQCRSCYTMRLIIEEAYRRNKIDVNKYINTECYVFDLS